ncbi:PREDICTED: lamin-like protein [Erythranthe guttata]|nr:PREDICTED: lamin-like protein [Erythranthe guttata]|eukprot:XP_012855175.1 PREDICTED: lamin-like protein [Erythranthe guttata]
MGCLAAVMVLLAAAMLPCTGGALIKVGGKPGWALNVNYTDWATHRHFYVGDWLYFVFDKRYYTVLEVNETNYEQCRDSEFIKNITRGGRDVFNLTESRDYYFLSSGGYCFHGMKLAIHVNNQLPPIYPPPSKNNVINDASPQSNGGGRFIIFSLSFLTSIVLKMLVNDALK